jgi:hypothetical protein
MDASISSAVHLKGMAVADYGEGFLLVEMPLGDGMRRRARAPRLRWR